MKRNWQPEELIEHWTLIPTELDLLSKKTATNRLGIALLLKYFQYEGHFPTSKAEIPRDVIRYVAQLLKVSPDRFENYDWQARTIKTHRALIRDFLGVTEATVRDAQNLTAWLETQVLAYDLKLESLEIAAAERLRHLKIELPTPERLQRIVRSAIRRFESNFSDSIAQELSSSVRKKLDELLETTSDNNNSENPEDTENTAAHKNNSVQILTKNNGWIKLSPFAALPEPLNLKRLKREIEQRWSMTSLLDMLSETDLRVKFTRHFKSVSSRENLDPKVLQKRLLIDLYGLGTNTGIKRLSLGELGEKYQDLLYVRRKFIHKSQLRNAIAEIINATFAVKLPQIWGEGTTTCASDSKKFGAWDQNLMTEWHIRYGGKGVMIYWHVDKNSACIYSQLKTCSSSEVAAMIEGLLRHCTKMKVEKNYVDSHGQSEVAFAFCHLLGFNLMPRLKAIYRQKTISS